MDPIHICVPQVLEKYDHHDLVVNEMPHQLGLKLREILVYFKYSSSLSLQILVFEEAQEIIANVFEQLLVLISECF